MILPFIALVFSIFAIHYYQVFRMLNTMPRMLCLAFVTFWNLNCFIILDPCNMSCTGRAFFKFALMISFPAAVLINFWKLLPPYFYYFIPPLPYTTTLDLTNCFTSAALSIYHANFVYQMCLIIMSSGLDWVRQSASPKLSSFSAEQRQMRNYISIQKYYNQSVCDISHFS